MVRAKNVLDLLTCPIRHGTVKRPRLLYVVQMGNCGWGEL